MTLLHAIFGFILVGIIGIGVGYGFRGLINRLGKKFEAPLLGKFNDIYAKLEKVRNSAETDAAKVKEEVLLIMSDIRKMIP